MDDKDKDLRAGNEALAGGEVVSSNLGSVDAGARRADLVDDELPGFKVNDYSGEGMDDENVGSDSEGVTVGSDKESSAVGAGLGAESETDGAGPVENASVARGEGSISADTSINGNVGGSDETAPKTAVNGVELTSEDMTGATGGISGVNEILRAETSGVDGARITEAEARAMLIEDNARAKEDLKKARNKGKRTLIVVIIIGVVLVIAGVAVSIILGGMRSQGGAGGADNVGNNDKQEGDATAGEKPEQGLVEISVDDDSVRGVYGRFEIGPFQSFYYGELADGWDDETEREGGRLGMALNNLQLEECRANAENGGLAERYDGNVPVGEPERVLRCYSGGVVRKKYRELFGEDVVLTEEKYAQDKPLAAGGRFLRYSGGYDEFYDVPGGAQGTSYIRGLEKAEKEGDKLYLYERALTLNCRMEPRFDEDGNQLENGSFCGVLTVAASCATPEFGWNEKEGEMTDEEVLAAARKQRLGLLKWTFEKDAAGNYVFKGMERVIEGKEE